jgi:cyclopropane-fatty-acyl-phospholipid synthase
LAKKYGAKVTGVTLSRNQKEYADANFSHPDAKILLQDYRHVRGRFDRVLSVGMFEHIGRKNYAEYFDKCHDLLKDNGLMLLHTIGTNSRGWSANSFINKYIFPEGELPHQSNLTGKFIDKWHLEDWQNFGLSYAKTLRRWRANIGDWSGLDKYEAKFRRMWQFYLLGCAANFQQKHICLWQIVYTKYKNTRPTDCHHARGDVAPMSYSFAQEL